MEINFFTVLITILNLAILGGIIVFIFKLIQGFRGYMAKSKEMDKKLDKILSKLEEK